MLLISNKSRLSTWSVASSSEIRRSCPIVDVMYVIIRRIPEKERSQVAVVAGITRNVATAWKDENHDSVAPRYAERCLKSSQKDIMINCVKSGWHIYHPKDGHLTFFSRIKLKLMDDTNEGSSIPDDVQATVDGWENWSNPGSVDAPNKCWWIRPKIDLPYRPDARNNCGRMRPMKDYPHQIMYKQLLMDERTEGIHARWCTKQLLMDQTKEELSIPDDVQNNC